MNLLLQLLASLLTTLGFAIITNVPKKQLIYAGISGMSGWLCYSVILNYLNSPLIAIFMGAFSVAISAYYFAMFAKAPVTLFIIPGIFPLVPGIIAFQAIKTALQNDYLSSIQLLIKTGALSFSIALALFSAELCFTVYKKVKYPSNNKI